MRILLDTHIALWLAVSPDRLSEPAAMLLRDPRQELLFSAASAWEIAVKHASDKLPLTSSPDEFVPELCRRLKLSVLPIELPHALRAGALPLHHRDPFDRMLVAQAQVTGAPIMTVDAKLERYEVEVIAG